MSDKIIENNQVTIMGVVASGFTYSHEVFGEGFYMADVLVKRLSNSKEPRSTSSIRPDMRTSAVK